MLIKMWLGLITGCQCDIMNSWKEVTPILRQQISKNSGHSQRTDYVYPIGLLFGIF